MRMLMREGQSRAIRGMGKWEDPEHLWWMATRAEAPVWAHRGWVGSVCKGRQGEI